jgi:hypothetical protein
MMMRRMCAQRILLIKQKNLRGKRRGLSDPKLDYTSVTASGFEASTRAQQMTAFGLSLAAEKQAGKLISEQAT